MIWSKNTDKCQNIWHEDHYHPSQYQNFNALIFVTSAWFGNAGITELDSTAFFLGTNTDQGGAINLGWVSVCHYSPVFNISFVGHNYSISAFLSIKLVKYMKKKTLKLSSFNLTFTTKYSMKLCSS